MEKGGLGAPEEIMGTLEKSNNDILSYVLKQPAKGQKQAPRMAFTENPDNYANFSGLFIHNEHLLPNYLKKTIRIQDHLIASILRNRANQLSSYGRIRKDRFDIGVNIAIKSEFEALIKPEQMEIIQKRINRAERLILTCGKNVSPRVFLRSGN